MWTCTQADGRLQKPVGLSKTRWGLLFTTPTCIRTRKEPKLVIFRLPSKSENFSSLRLKSKTGSSLQERTQALAFMIHLTLQKRRKLSVRKPIPASSTLKFQTVKTLRSKIRSSRDPATTPTCSQRQLPESSAKWEIPLVNRNSVQALHPEAIKTSILSWVRHKEVTSGKMSSMLLSPRRHSSGIPVLNNTSLTRRRVMILRAAFSKKKLFRLHFLSRKNVIATRVSKHLTPALALISISITPTILLSVRAWPRSARIARWLSHRESSLEFLDPIRSAIRTAGLTW